MGAPTLATVFDLPGVAQHVTAFMPLEVFRLCRVAAEWCESSKLKDLWSWRALPVAAV